MRKARLGFEIYSTDDELLVDEDKDFIRKEKDQEWASHQKSKARKLRCYNKHKDQYNAQRRAKAATIVGRYHTAKTKALAVGQKWQLSHREWISIWVDAGFVIVPGTVTPSRPEGVRRTAFSMRGPNKLTNTMMSREDVSAPWSASNCYISFRSEPLQGSSYHAEQTGL